MSSTEPTHLSHLTTKQRYWYEHLERARDNGTSLAAYAREQDLDIKALYHYQSVLRQKSVVKTESPFTRVTHTAIIKQPTAQNNTIIIHLSNGHRLEVPGGLADLSTILQAVQSV